MKLEVVKKELIAQGAKEVKNVTVKNVTVTQFDDWCRIALTLNDEITGFVKDGNDEFSKGKVDIIFTSTFSISSILKEYDETAFAADYLRDNPEALKIILSRSTIDIIQEEVEEGTEYINPFSTSRNATVFEHNTIINHIVGIKLSEKALKVLDKIEDKMLGL